MTDKKPGRKKDLEQKTTTIVVRIDPITEKKLQYIVNGIGLQQSETIRKIIEFAYDGLKEAEETYLKEKENKNDGTEITS